MFLSSCNNNIQNLETSDQLFANNFNALPLNMEQFKWGVAMSGYQSEGYDTSSIWYYWDISGKTHDRNVKGVDFYRV